MRALLDFGASGARAAVALVTPDQVEILGTAEVTGRSGIARPGEVMHRQRIASLAERALSAAERSSATDGELPAIADEAIVGLTGPMLEAYGEPYHLRRMDPAAPIFEAEILESLGVVQAHHLAALRERAQSDRIRRTLVASQLVAVMSVREDNWSALRLPDVTRGVPGEAGDLLSMVICNLTWPGKGMEVLNSVMETLELELLSATPIAQAVAAALPRPDAILLDIGVEHTEIALVEHGALNTVTSIALGGNFFGNRLMDELHLPEKHAEVVKRQGSHEWGRPVLRVLNQAITSWRGEVEQRLLELAGDAPLPPRFYLYGGGAQLAGLVEQLRSHPWMRRLPFERHPEVARLVPNQLRGLHDARGLLHAPAQVGLGALAAWAGREASPLQAHLDGVSERLAPIFSLT